MSTEKEIQLPRYLLYLAEKEIESKPNLTYYLNRFLDVEIHSFLTESYFNNFTYGSITTLSTEFFKKVLQHKRRWVRAQIEGVNKGKATKNNDRLLLLFTEKEYMYENLGERAFLEEFGFLNPQDWLEHKINQLTTWANDKNSLVVDFPFIEQKTEKMIRSALEKDVSMILANILLQQYEGDPSTIIMKQPDIQFPITSNRKGRFPNTSVKVKTEVGENQEIEQHYLLKAQIQMSDSITFNQYVIDNPSDNSVFRRLTHEDMYVLNEICSVMDISFILGRKISFPLREVVSRVYDVSNPQKHHIRKFINSIKRLHMTHFSFENQQTKRSWGFNLISDYDIQETKDLVEISISDFLYQKITNNQILHFYRKEVRLVENQVNFNLFLTLQKDRILHYLNGQPMERVYPFNFLKSQYETASTRKDEIRRELKEAFQVLVDNGIILDSFSEQHYVFKVRFKELSKYEIDDLVSAGYRLYDDVLPLELDLLKQEGIDLSK